jgi:hypothetical protein
MELCDLDVNQRLSIRLRCEPVALRKFRLKRVVQRTESVTVQVLARLIIRPLYIERSLRNRQSCGFRGNRLFGTNTVDSKAKG